MAQGEDLIAGAEIYLSHLWSDRDLFTFLPRDVNHELAVV